MSGYDQKCTDIDRDLSHAHPVIARKTTAILKDVNNYISNTKQYAGYTLCVFETYRTDERQEMLFAQKRSKIRRGGKHSNKQKGKPYALAVDVGFKFNGIWTWNVPEKLWSIVRKSQTVHNCRIISWDYPHCELKGEDYDDF